MYLRAVLVEHIVQYRLSVRMPVRLKRSVQLVWSGVEEEKDRLETEMLEQETQLRTRAEQIQTELLEIAQDENLTATEIDRLVRKLGAMRAVTHRLERESKVASPIQNAEETLGKVRNNLVIIKNLC